MANDRASRTRRVLTKVSAAQESKALVIAENFQRLITTRAIARSSVTHTGSSASWCTVCSVRWQATRQIQGPCATSGTFKLPTFTLVHPSRIFPILPEGKSNSMSLVREERVSTIDVKHGSGGSVRRTWRRHCTGCPFSFLASSVSIRTGPAWDDCPPSPRTVSSIICNQ